MRMRLHKISYIFCSSLCLTMFPAGSKIAFSCHEKSAVAALPTTSISKTTLTISLQQMCPISRSNRRHSPNLRYERFDTQSDDGKRVGGDRKKNQKHGHEWA